MSELRDMKKREAIPPIYIVLFVFLTALLLPHSLFFSPGENLTIYAHLWLFRFGYWEFQFSDLTSWYYGLVLVGLRYIFPYQVGRYCMGKISRHRALMWGIAGEIPLLLFSMLYLLSPILFPLYPQITFLTPIPSSLIVGLAIMKIMPSPKAITNWRGDKIQEIWPELDFDG